MTKKRIKLILITSLLIVAFFFLLEKNFLPGVSTKLSPDKSFDLLGNVITLIRDDYVEVPNPSKTMEGAFKGLVDSLDVLSSYLDKETAAKYRQRKDPDLKDTGIVVYKKYGAFPVVIGIREDSPAEKKGVKIGEHITALDEKSTLNMSMVEANLYLRSDEEAPLRLKILQADQNKDVGVERTHLFQKPFSYSSAKGTSGILSIYRFYSPCVSEIKEKILPRLKQAKRPLILDLRNCCEGEIEEALRFVNLFLKAEKIGYLEKKGEKKEVLSCYDEAELDKLDLVIWVNQATLGPAEAVAGVLQEYKNARVIGIQTLGLVAEQDLFDLNDGSSLLLTTAIFHITPEKKLWQEGIKPDIKLEGKEQSLSAYLKESFKFYPET